jgi:hypothetical protein
MGLFRSRQLIYEISACGPKIGSSLELLEAGRETKEEVSDCLMQVFAGRTIGSLKGKVRGRERLGGHAQLL